MAYDLYAEFAAATVRTTGKSVDEWESAFLGRIRHGLRIGTLRPGYPYTEEEMQRIHRGYGLDEGDMIAVVMKVDDVIRKRRNWAGKDDYVPPECKTTGKFCTEDVLVWMLNPDRFED